MYAWQPIQPRLLSLPIALIHKLQRLNFVRPPLKPRLEKGEAERQKMKELIIKDTFSLQALKLLKIINLEYFLTLLV